ncbi:MAG: isoprenylcysteine carboxylmethyltransferase family protein [Candidatus Omnitrophica bacterium]|nr:isoprenylcysteine carboxylmethyltransferase family protein [Candidatus Omnitrophota bacterium]
MHGEDPGNYAYGMWMVVAFNVILFSFFVLSFLKPKTTVEWRSMGAFMGFLVALFTEMYGFPLTIYLLSGWMGKSYPVLDPFSHSHGHLWLVLLGLADSKTAMTVLHAVTNGMIFYGLYVMQNGWVLIHAAKGKHLVTEGVYARVRHPQYSGLFLITSGFLIQWPSLLTLVMWPILTFAYYRLAMREEKDVERHFGQAWLDYKARVPAFIPGIGKVPTFS